MHPVAHGGRRRCLEVGHVRAVHAEDQVEAVKILRRYLARPLPGNVDAVMRRDRHRARIGRGADLPAAGRRRIEQDMAPLLARRPDVAENAFGQW